MLLQWLMSLPSPLALWEGLVGTGPGKGLPFALWLGSFLITAIIVWLLLLRLMTALFPYPSPGLRAVIFTATLLCGAMAGAALGFSVRPWLFGV